MKIKILSKILNETKEASALVWFDYELNMSIYVFNNSIYEPYFALLNNTDIMKATKCSRVCIMKNKYIIAQDKRNWYLDGNLLLTLKDVLKRTIEYNYTVWESIIDSFFVEQYRLILKKEQLPKIEIPDYLDMQWKDRIVIS